MNSRHSVSVILLGGAARRAHLFLMCSFLVLSGPPANASLNNGLVAYWKLDETSGTAAPDFSGNAFHGTLYNGPAWTTGQLGGGLSFDGTNDYVAAPGIPNFGADFSIALWLNMPPGAALARSAVSKQSDAFRGWNLWIDNDDIAGAPELNFLGDSGSNGKITGPADLRDGKWHHVVVVKVGDSRGDWRMYVDGIAQNVLLGGSDPTGNSTITTPVKIGARRDTSSSFFQGTLDEIRLYNRALTADEAAALWDAGRRGLLMHLKLDETSGTTAADASRGAHQGTLLNGPVWSEGYLDGALHFDGVNDFLTTNFNTSSVGNSNTVAFWLYADVFKDYQALYSRAGYDFEMRTGAGGTVWFYGKARSGSIDGLLSENQWYHLAVVETPSDIRLYVDGTLIGISTTSISTSAGTLAIGARNGGSLFFEGKVDDFRVYDRALSPEDVAGLFYAGRRLLAHWKLDETSGTTATDSSGNGYHGTLLNGPAWTGGQVDGGLSFDGTNDYVSAPHVPNFGADFTIALWLNMAPDAATGRSVISKQNDSLRGWNFGITDGAPELNYRGDGGSSGRITGLTDLRDGQWHHVAFVKEGDQRSDWKLYVDGVAQSVPPGGSDTSGNASVSTPVKIGARQDSTQSFFQGKLDDIRLYDKILTAAEIGSIFEAGNTGLVMHLRLDEASGKIAADSSGNSNHGWAVKDPLWTEGRIQGALRFDASTNRLIPRCPTSVVGAENTVSFWAYADVLKDYQVLYSRAGDAFEFRASGDGYVWFYGKGRRGVGNGDLAQGQWHHIVVVETPLDIKLYVDGVSKATGTATVSMTDSGFTIGSRDGGTFSFEGKIDDFRLYNRALTQMEIDAIRNAAPKPKGARIIKWVEIR